MASAFTGVRILDFTRNQQGPSARCSLPTWARRSSRSSRPAASRVAAAASAPTASAPTSRPTTAARSRSSLNMRTGARSDIVRKLIPSVDVVVRELPPRRHGALGPRLRGPAKIKPDIILASASAWGREGPWARRPGYDHVAQALSGVMYEQGGGPTEEPHALFGGFADQIGGLMLAFGIASALYVRATTGKGQHVDASLIGEHDVAAVDAARPVPAHGQAARLRVPPRRPPTRTTSAPDGGYIAIAANTQDMWERFCDAAAPDSSTTRASPSPFGRSDNKMVLVAVLEELFLTQTSDEWGDLLYAADVPHAPVLTYAGLRRAPAVRGQPLHPGDRPRRTSARCASTARRCTCRRRPRTSRAAAPS